MSMINNTPGFHKCFFCPFGTKSSFFMGEHVNHHRHGRKKFECNVGIKLYHCVYCNYNNEKVIAMNEHMDKFHMGKSDCSELELQTTDVYYFCRHCEFQTHSVLNWYKHTFDVCPQNKNRTEKGRTCTQSGKRWKGKSKNENRRPVTTYYVRCPDCFVYYEEKYLLSHREECKMSSISDVDLLEEQPQEVKRTSERKLCKKTNACPYCGKSVLNFARHLLRHHQDKTAVRNLKLLPPGHANRTSLLTAIRRQGNFASYSKNEKLCPVRRPPNSQIVDPDSYAACPDCLGYYKKKSLERHRKHCEMRVKAENPGRIMHLSESQIVATCYGPYSSFYDSLRLKKEVFPNMRSDIVSKTAMSDILICCYAEDLLNKYKIKHQISNRMRELGRLLIQLRKTTGIQKMIDGLKPVHFHEIVAATKIIGGYNPESQTYKAPSLVLNFGGRFKQLCDTASKLILDKNPVISCQDFEEKLKDVKEMRRLFETQWHTEVSRRAVSTAATVKVMEGRDSKINSSEDLNAIIGKDNSQNEILSPVKTSPNCQILESTSYVPCPHCLVYYKTIDLQKHKKQCAISSISHVDSVEEQPQAAKPVRKFKKATNACPYCLKLVTHFARHIFRHHGDKIAVQKLKSLPPKHADRVAIIAAIRRQGNFVSYSKNEQLLPVRRPTHSQTVEPECYAVCPDCLGYYKKKYLQRHRRQCRMRAKAKTQGRVMHLSESQIVAICSGPYSSFYNSLRLTKEIFPNMRSDEVSKTAMSDILICCYAEDLLNKYKTVKIRNLISNRIREFGRLLIQLKKTTGIQKMIDVLKPKFFNEIVAATKVISGYNPETQVYNAPSLVLHFGGRLKQLCDTATKLIMEKNPVLCQDFGKLRDVKDINILLQTRWHTEFSNSKFNDAQEHRSDVASDCSEDLNVPRVEKPKKFIPRNRWSEEQKSVVKDFFKNHIEEKKAPKKHEVELLINKHKELFKGRNWVVVKAFVYNCYKK